MPLSHSSLPLRALVLFAALSAGAAIGPVHSASAEAILLVEADTGKVLQAEGATFPWYPASLTKLMTVYVTLYAVKQHSLSLNKLFVVSANAAAQQPSKMGFKPGTQITVDNVLKMLMVKSANDMAVVLAEGVSGSVENFTAQMNATARRLGMTQTNYVNPNGLPADDQITSARDLAILARALIRDFPEYDYYWHIPAIKLGKRIMRNFNPLIAHYPGADGMKTGFICASGFNLVATATRDNRRLIAVVLGASSSKARALKAAELLEKGFSNTGPAWLTPVLGNVDQLVPVDSPLPNMREDVCSAARHRANDSAEDEPPASHEADPTSALAVSAESARGEPVKPANLLLDQDIALAPPIEVSVIPPKRQTPSAGMAQPQKSAAPGLAKGPLPRPKPKL